MPPLDMNSIIVYLVAAAIGWFLRHKNILPMPGPSNPTPVQPSPLDALIAQLLAKLQEVLNKKQEAEIQAVGSTLIEALSKKKE